MHSSHSLPLPPDVRLLMQQAFEYRKGGRPAEAAALYQQLLVRFPRHPELLGALGEARMQQGDFLAALLDLEQARQAAPSNAQHWLSLTQCLLALGRAKDAKKVISEAIGKGLRHPLADELLRQARSGKGKTPEKPVPLGEALRQLETLLRAGRYAEVEKLGGDLHSRHAKSAQLAYLRGMAVLLQRRPRDAIPLLRRAGELDTGLVPAHYNLGYALESLGRFDEALTAYRRAIAAAPQLADAHNSLGNILQKLAHHDAALAAYDCAIALRPESAEYHMNRGDALRNMGQLEKAVAAYESAVKLKPGLSAAYVSLAFVLGRLERDEASLTAFQHAIDASPGYFEAYQGMGHTLRRLGRHHEAVEAYRRALELRPDDAVAHKDLGVALKNSGSLEAGLAELRRAQALQPDLEAAIRILAETLLDMGCHDEAIETYREGLARNPDGFFRMHSNLLLALNYQAGGASDILLAEACAFGEKAARRAAPFAHHANSPIPERRLRVGLVSGDLGQHPVGFFLQNVLESFDPAKLAVFAYATSNRRDALNERLRRAIPHWRDAGIDKLDDEALASQIRADGIDILIDLAGHTAHNRLPVFAWKPAPVQVSWLGYFATTGLHAMDYILADPHVLPEEEEGHFVEKPWRLPEVYYCFSPPEVAIDVAPLPVGQTGLVTFGCFNNPSKINDSVIACWARVLGAVGNSQLVLKYQGYEDLALVKRILGGFAQFGIAGERIRFEGSSPRDEYLAAYHQVDIALDPFPFPGGTTSIEGLWMGVPVLTLTGDRFISHQGETILHNVGLPEWVAADADDYVAKAARFAGDREALAALRAGLRARLLASPLCDAPRFARNFEDAMRGMWQKWCAKQALPKPAE